MTVGVVQSPHWTSASSGLASTDSLALFVFLETDVLVPRVSSKDAKVVDDTLCSAAEEVGRVRELSLGVPKVFEGCTYVGVILEEMVSYSRGTNPSLVLVVQSKRDKNRRLQTRHNNRCPRPLIRLM